jgi:hypothetical protein
MNKQPITQETYNNWMELSKQAAVYEGAITDRISFIIYRSCEMFSQGLSTWYFEDAGEGEVGDIYRNLQGNLEFQVELVFKPGSGKEPMYLILKDDTECDLKKDGFPVRWLFEDFEEEIKSGKQKYKEKDIIRKTELKRLSEQRRLEVEALAQSARSKLSKQELDALRKVL